MVAYMWSPQLLNNECDKGICVQYSTMNDGRITSLLTKNSPSLEFLP